MPYTVSDKTCRDCLVNKPAIDFTRKAASPDGLAPYCRDCSKDRRDRRRARQLGRTPASRSAPTPTIEGRADYIMPRDVLATWAAVQMIAADGDPAPNMFFVGPSGSGKTEAGRAMATLAGLPFVKVDAPAMTDEEVWFGTREVVVENGAPKTVYHESAFVRALQMPCVLVIDEANRTADRVRNILLAVLDDTRSVTNPLTGETVVRHPECYIILTGNVGLAFTGTYAVDIAFTTRALTSRFEYLSPSEETAVAIGRTGVSEKDAALFVRFATESRTRAKADADFPPISTREVLTACRLVAKGLDRTTAARQAIINAASDEGGAESTQAALELIWAGINPDRGY